MIRAYLDASFDFSTPNTSKKPNNLLNVNIYPNPTQNLLNIQSEQKNIKISLFNIEGKCIRTYENKNQIDLSFLKTGLYFLKFSTEEGHQTFKIQKY